MRKSLFYLPFVAALALTGCSKDDLEVAGENGGNNGPVETQYLAINIATTPDGGTRATPTAGAEGNQYGDLFEDGTVDENKVNKVRFYFFNNNGQPVSVDSETGHSYLDWTPTDEEQSDNAATNDCGNDEKILKAVVVIETAKIGELPTQVVAVVNPSDAMVDVQKTTLVDIRAAARDYASLANNADNPQFVMTNSVYALGDKEITTTAITRENYQETRDEAKANPITIHVERTVAKVRLNSKLQNTTEVVIDGKKHILLPMKSYDENTKTEAPIKVENKQVYLDVEGWNVTRTLKYAYVLKHINVTWQTVNFFPGAPSMSWNDPDHFRSYWAQICTYNGIGKPNLFGDFDHAKEFKLNSKVYATENGQHKIPDVNTYDYPASEIIIAGTICDENGNPVTVCELAGARMFGEEDLKNSYINLLEQKGHSHYWLDESKPNEKKFVEIAPSDIKFLTHAEAAAAGLVSGFTLGESAGQYMVFATLTDEAAEKTWYKDASVDAETETGAVVKNQLIALGHSKIWNEGRTYFYTEIGHFGNTSGVIRNHIYEINLNGLYGLGTPVYKPEEIIYPEKPSSEEAYVAAQIRILSWRVVENDVTLNWGK